MQRSSFCLLGAMMLACLPVDWSCAASYYVDAMSGNNANAGTIDAPWQTLDRATYPYYSTVLATGDTVYLRGGLYSGNSNSMSINAVNAQGTAGSPVTIKNYPGEVPVIANIDNFPTGHYNNRGFDIRHANYWTFEGLCWSNNFKSGSMESVTNIVFTNCTFGYIPWGGIATNVAYGTSYPFDWAQVSIVGDSYFNQFRNCTFCSWGNILTNPPSNYWVYGTHLSIGDDGADYNTRYNLVQGCKFYRAGHDLLEVWTDHNVIRGNEFHNEPFIATNNFCHKLYNAGSPRDTENPLGLWSARIMKPGDQTGPTQIDSRNLWESNTFYYAGFPADSDGANGIEMATCYNIYRYNCIAFAYASGIHLIGSGSVNCTYSNAIYNNVIFSCGQAWVTGNSRNSIMAGAGGGCGIYRIGLDPKRTNNFIVNNIIWGNYPRDVSVNVSQSGEIYRTNWTSDDHLASPLFRSTNGAGYVYNPANLPDFRLQTNSPCIDTGTWLAYITSASRSGTNFTVDNSLYFSDGNQIVTGDTIQLQGQTNTAVVLVNDWTNNIITFTPALTWTKGQGVSLAYNGAAPDMGAFEFSQAARLPAPAGVHVLTNSVPP